MIKTRMRNRWPALFSAILLILIASYSYYSGCIYPANKTAFILTYGILCAVSILFLSLYSVRKNSYSQKLGTRQSWMEAHIYIGIISSVLLFMHFSFKPTGTFSIFLSILFFLVVISGITGAIIYSYVPLSLTKFGRTVKSLEEINSSIENSLDEADNLVSGVSDKLKTFYKDNIRSIIESKKTKWRYLSMTEKELLQNRRKLIEKCRSIVPGQDIHDLDILSSILIEKEKLSFMQAKLRMQEAWLTVHMPLTFTLLTATLIHIVTVLYY